MVNILKKVNLLTKSNYSISFCMLTPVCFGMECDKEQPNNAKKGQSKKADKTPFIKSFFHNKYLTYKKEKVTNEIKKQLGEIKKKYEDLKNSGKNEKDIKNGIFELGYRKGVNDAFLENTDKNIEQIVESNPDLIDVLFQADLYDVLLHQIKKEEEVDLSGEIGYARDVNVTYDNDPRYNMCSFVGKGGFSQVVLGAILAKKKTQPGKDVYVDYKVFKFSYNDKHYDNELKLLSKIVNKNVINLSLYGTLSKFKDNNKEYKLRKDIAYLGLEYCKFGDLGKFKKECLKNRLCSEAFLCYIGGQVLKGLTFLHSQNICHYDIKPANILVNDCLQFKITDFSISFKISNNTSLKLKHEGTENYMAPEVVREVTIDNQKNLYKPDVYSFGVMLYRLFTSNFPYHKDKETGELVFDDIKGTLEDCEASPVFKDFLTKCLIEDYDKRPSSSDLLQHQFIKKIYPMLLNLDENMYNKGHFFTSLSIDCFDYETIANEYEFDKDGKLVCKGVNNEDTNIIKLEESQDNNIIEDNIDKDGFKIPESINKKDDNIDNNIIKLEESQDNKIIKDKIDNDGFKIPESINKKDDNIIKLEESQDNKIIKDKIDNDGFKIHESIKKKDNNIGNNIIRIPLDKSLISLNKDKKASKKGLKNKEQKNNNIGNNIIKIDLESLNDNKENNVIKIDLEKSLISFNNFVKKIEDNNNNDIEIEEDIKEEDKKEIKHIGKKRNKFRIKLDDNK